jgi:hypothetical protein
MTEITDDQTEALGMLADKLDTALYAAKLPLPPQMHVEQLSNIIREVRDELATHVRDILGDDPWDTNPLSG